VVANPGDPFSEVEAYIRAADTLVIFEGPYRNSDPNGPSFSSYPNRGPYTGLSPWWMHYDSSRFANLVYGTSTQLEMVGSAMKSIGSHAGYVYITDDLLPNPWDTLPSCWDHEVATIQLINGRP